MRLSRSSALLDSLDEAVAGAAYGGRGAAGVAEADAVDGRLELAVGLLAFAGGGGQLEGVAVGEPEDVAAAPSVGAGERINEAD